MNHNKTNSLRPLKILFLTHKFYPDLGGIEVNSEILAKGFMNSGHEVRLLTWTEEIGEKEFPFKIIRKPSLQKLFEQHLWADVVYENNPCLRLAWPSLFLKKPSVVALRTWINRMDGQIAWQDRLKFKWLAGASAVIAVSEGVRKRNWPKAVVIGNPYRIELFKKNPQVPKSFGFVFLGRLVSDKGVDLAISAFQKLLERNYQNDNNPKRPSLTIIGEGPEREKLEQLVVKFGIKKDVVFKGALRGEALVNCLNQHPYLLVPSVWEEPFGNVALEGMACDCLPIVSDGGGLPDAVGKAGLVFKRGDVDSLLNCMEKVMKDPQMELTIRNQADEHLAAHHPDVISQRYLKVIEGAVLKNN